MRYVPLSKIVAASIIDTSQDVSRVEELYYHWAARGLNKLVNEELRVDNIKKSIWLPVDENTRAAFLPLDFDVEYFVGMPVDGGIAQIAPAFFADACAETKDFNTCKRCKKGIDCGEGKTTESVENVILNGTAYQKTTLKTLYPNGELIIEENTPYVDTDGITISYLQAKRRLASYDLTDCGCIADSPELRDNLPEMFCGSYTGETGYQILPEAGIIKLSDNYSESRIYLEYRGFLCKVNGEYAAPDIAFETLVEWTKFKAMQNRPTKYSLSEREWQKQNYIRERKNMMKVQGKVFLKVITDSLNAIPQFPISTITTGYYAAPKRTVVANTSKNQKSCNNLVASGSISGSIVNNNNITIVNKGNRAIALKIEAGSLLIGQSKYQNDLLKGGEVEYVLVNNTIETKLSGDFTFNPTTGEIDRGSNTFALNDVLVINYNAGT